MAKKRYNVGGKGSLERMPQGDVMSHGMTTQNESLYIQKQTCSQLSTHTSFSYCHWKHLGAKEKKYLGMKQYNS